MQHKNTHHVSAFWSRERRALCFSEVPDYSEGGVEKRDQRQQNYERWQQVFQYLRDAPAYNADESLKKIINNQDNIRMIAAVVDLNQDGSITWTDPEAVRRFAIHIHEAFTKESQEVGELAADISNQVEAFTNAATKAKEDMQKSIDEYADNDPTKAALQEAGEIIEEVEDDPIKLRNRQEALFFIQGKLLRATELSVPMLRNILDEPEQAEGMSLLDHLFKSEMIDLLMAYTRDETVVIKKGDVDTAGKDRFKDAQVDLLEMIKEKANIPLYIDEGGGTSGVSSAEDRVEKLQELQTTFDNRLEELQAEWRTATGSTDYIERRQDYIEMMVGYTPGTFVMTALDANKKFNPALLRADIIQAQPDIDISEDTIKELSGIKSGEVASKQPELNNFVFEFKSVTGEAITLERVQIALNSLIIDGKGKEALAEVYPALTDEQYKSLEPWLLAAWDTQPIADYLKKQGFEGTDSSSTLSDIMHNSFLPEEKVDALKEAGLEEMPIGFIADLAEIFRDEPGNSIEINDEITEQLLNLISSEIAGEPDKRLVERRKFIDLYTFINLGTSSSEAVRAEATAKWNTLLPIVAGTPVPDAAEVKIPKDELFKVLTNRVIDPVGHTTTSSLVLSEIARKDFVQFAQGNKWDEMELSESFKKMTLGTLETAGDGSAVWWEFVSNVPGYYLDGNLNKRLIEIRPERIAVKRASAAIDHVMTQSSLAGKAMGTAENNLRVLLERQQDALGPRGIDDSVWEHMEGAEFLEKTSQIILGQLERENDWSNLPKSVREVSFWLAMHKGMDEAKEFLRQYHKTPEEPVVDQIIYEGNAMKNAGGPEAEARFYLNRLSDEDRARYNELEIPLDDAQKQELAALAYKNFRPVNRRKLFMSYYIRTQLGEDRKALESYMAQIDALEEQSGQDVLAGMRNRHGITVRPMALQALAALNTRTVDIDNTIDTEVEREDGAVVTTTTETETTTTNTRISVARNIERWTIARDGDETQKEQVKQALYAVLDGPNNGSVDAMIHAFVYRETAYYVNDDGVEVPITPEEAYQEVTRIQRHLANQARMQDEGNDVLDEWDLYEDPIEKNLRGALETLQDLWAGDWVDKAKAIGAVVAAIWLIRTIWKKGSEEGASPFMRMMKWGMVGLPILMVGNAMIKNRTGKDYLGQMLHYMPKEKQQGSLVSFMRRMDDYEDEFGNNPYEVLGTNAGHESMRQLTGPRSNITVKELLQWRDQVRMSGDDGKLGYNDYSSGAPNGLNVSAVQYELGINASKQDAYRAIFMTFEALCVDVAQLHGQGGDRHLAAEWGADYMRQNYVDFGSYGDSPALQQRMLDGRPATMHDVIISESNTPERYAEIMGDETFMEWLAGTMGWTVDETKRRLIQLGTAAKLHMSRTGELAQELWPEKWASIKENASNIYEYLAVTGEKFSEDMLTNLDASWRWVVQTGSDIGLMIKKGAPGAIETTIDFGIAATNASIDVVQNLYRELQRHSISGNAIEALDELTQRIFGVTLTSLIVLRRSVENRVDEQDHLEKLAEYEPWRTRFKNHLSTISETPPTDPLIEGWTQKAMSELSVSGSPTDAITSPEAAQQRMAAYQLVKRYAYSHLVTERAKLVEAVQDDTLSEIEYPMRIDWPADWEAYMSSDPLYSDVFNSYGTNTTPALLGIDRSIFGDMEEGPLGFMHWSVDWATRDEATEYMVHNIVEHVSPFLAEAEEEFKDNPTKLNEYRSFIDSLVTNALIEVTLGAREAEEGRPPDVDKKLLTLTVNQAQDFLEFLKLSRGIAGRVEDVEGLNFEKFAYDASKDKGELEDLLSNPELRRMLQSPDTRNPVTAAEEVPRKAPTSRMRSAVDDAKDDDLPEELPETTLEDLVAALGREGITATDTMAIRKALKERANKFLADNEPEPSNLDQYGLFLRGLPAGPELQKMRQELYHHTVGSLRPTDMPDVSKLEPIKKLRNEENRPAEKRRLQDVLDRAALDLANHIRKQIIKVPAAELNETHPNYTAWRDSLVELYEATSRSPDRVSDAVSLVLEYLLYKGRHGGVAKYREDLRRLSGNDELQVPDNRSYEYPGQESYFVRDSSGAAFRLTRPQVDLTEGFLKAEEKRFTLLSKKFAELDGR